jgi:serine/threonine protein kinase
VYKNKITGEVVKCYLNEEGNEYQTVREIALLKFLRAHPHVVTMKKVLTAGLPGGSELGITMEDGGITLESWIRRNRDSRRARLQHFPALATQITGTVCFLHKHRVMHRDLKPTNILISLGRSAEPDAVPYVRVCDFGMAKIHQRRNSYQRCTLIYRPPELFTENTRYTMAVDVWAAGCILYEILRAAPLFVGESDQSVLQNIIQTVPVPEGVELELQGVDWSLAFRGHASSSSSSGASSAASPASTSSAGKMTPRPPRPRIDSLAKLRDSAVVTQRMHETQQLLNRMVSWEGKARPRAGVVVAELCRIFELGPPEIGTVERFFYRREKWVEGRVGPLRWFYQLAVQYKLQLRTLLLAVNLYEMALERWFLTARSPYSEQSEKAMIIAGLLLANKYYDACLVQEADFAEHFDAGFLWTWQWRLLEAFPLEQLLLEDLEEAPGGPTTCDAAPVKKRAQRYLRLLLRRAAVGKDPDGLRALLLQAEKLEL